MQFSGTHHDWYVEMEGISHLASIKSWKTMCTSFLQLRFLRQGSYLFNDKLLPIFAIKYVGWNFNSGNYLFTTDTK
jgi:hypothetical protein